MIKHVVCDGSGRFAKDITEDIIQFQVGYRKTVLCTVFLTSQHVCKLDTVTDQVTELTDFRRWNETWFDHIAHEEVTDPFSIFDIGFVTFLRLGVFRVSQSNKTGFFKDVEYGDPVLARRFQTNFETGVIGKPCS